MDAITALRERRSIRGFLPREVPREMLRKIIDDARWAPSSSNQQPWHFTAVGGQPLAALCEALRSAHAKRRKGYDPSRGSTIPEELVARTKKLFRELRPLLGSLGPEHRGFIESGSFRFYDAPAVVFMSMHQHLPPPRYMDMGMAAQNLMLSAHARGLGTCAIALTLLYADVLKTHVAIPAGHDIVLCLAIGYPDSDFPVNRFCASREDMKSCVTWVGL